MPSRGCVLVRLSVACDLWLLVVGADDGQGRAALRNAVGWHGDTRVWIGRPDLHDPVHPRCGEADLVVSRRGDRNRLDTVAYQADHRRFINIMTNPPYGHD